MMHIELQKSMPVVRGLRCAPQHLSMDHHRVLAMGNERDLEWSSLRLVELGLKQLQAVLRERPAVDKDVLATMSSLSS